MQENRLDGKVLAKILNPAMASYATYIDDNDRNVLALIANRGAADETKIYTLVSDGPLMVKEFGLENAKELALPKNIEFFALEDSEEEASLKYELRDRFISLWTRYSSCSEYQKKEWNEFQLLLMKLGIYPG